MLMRLCLTLSFISFFLPLPFNQFIEFELFLLLIHIPNSFKMSLGRTFKLNSGYEIPAVGLGTWVRYAQLNTSHSILY